MEDSVTKDDLRQFGVLLLENIRNLILDYNQREKELLPPQWVKSKRVKTLLDISAGSVQNLRVTEKVRFKKVLGSFYYNMEDLQKLFSDEPIK